MCCNVLHTPSSCLFFSFMYNSVCVSQYSTVLLMKHQFLCRHSSLFRIHTAVRQYRLQTLFIKSYGRMFIHMKLLTWHVFVIARTNTYKYLDSFGGASTRASRKLANAAASLPMTDWGWGWGWAQVGCWCWNSPAHLHPATPAVNCCAPTGSTRTAPVPYASTVDDVLVCTVCRRLPSVCCRVSWGRLVAWCDVAWQWLPGHMVVLRLGLASFTRLATATCKHMSRTAWLKVIYCTIENSIEKCEREPTNWFACRYKYSHSC